MTQKLGERGRFAKVSYKFFAPDPGACRFFLFNDGIQMILPLKIFPARYALLMFQKIKGAKLE